MQTQGEDANSTKKGPRAGNEPVTFMLRGDSDNHCGDLRVSGWALRS